MPRPRRPSLAWGGTLPGLLLFAVIAGGAPLAAIDEVPQWVVAGIAAVETGSTYRDRRLITYADRRDGAHGEVGPWQLSPAVLDDLHLLPLRDRIRSDVVFSEEVARAWLRHCFDRAGGDWDAAIALYHTGSRGSVRRGRLYAERARAAGMAAVSAARAGR